MTKKPSENSTHFTCVSILIHRTLNLFPINIFHFVIFDYRSGVRNFTFLCLSNRVLSTLIKSILFQAMSFVWPRMSQECGSSLCFYSTSILSLKAVNRCFKIRCDVIFFKIATLHCNIAPCIVREYALAQRRRNVAFLSVG